MMVPQCSPGANYQAYQNEIDAALGKVAQSGWYVLGEACRTFEKEFAAYQISQYGLGVANGTDALEMALRALGVGVEDIVATVSHTAVATVSAIARTGASPRFVDINDDFTMSAASLEMLLEQQVCSAVIVVHLYGQPADLNAIKAVCDRYEVPLIEDCAQAHGAEYQGCKVGTFGRFACFSFYPTKNLAALGDGGALLCQDARDYETIELLRQYGWRNGHRENSEVPGLNSRLDEIQAGVLSVKLRHLDAMNQRRRDIAAKYLTELEGIPGLELPIIHGDRHHVFHQFIVMLDQRDEVKAGLAQLGVGTAVHYPKAVHQQDAYRSIPVLVPLTQTELRVNKILSLPMYPELTDEEVQFVCDQLKKVVRP